MRQGEGMAKQRDKTYRVKHEEGHKHWEKEIANEVTCSHMWVELCFLPL
jgi:hypothetical protein